MLSEIMYLAVCSTCEDRWERASKTKDVHEHCKHNIDDA